MGGPRRAERAGARGRSRAPGPVRLLGGQAPLVVLVETAQAGGGVVADVDVVVGHEDVDRHGEQGEDVGVLGDDAGRLVGVLGRLVQRGGVAGEVGELVDLLVAVAAEVAVAAAAPVLVGRGGEGRGAAPAVLHDVVVLAGEGGAQVVGGLDGGGDADLGQVGLDQLGGGVAHGVAGGAQPERAHLLAVQRQRVALVGVPGVEEDLAGGLGVTAALAGVGDDVGVVGAGVGEDVVGAAFGLG